MRRQARVLEDAIAGSTVTVALEGLSNCQQCAKGKGCGAGVFRSASQPVHLACHTPDTVKAGQSVTIEHEEGDSSWLWCVAGAYGLPTVGLLGACWLASVFLPGAPPTDTASSMSGQREWLIGLISLAGLAGGVFAWRRLAPFTLSRVQMGPCLQSARIVAVTQSSLQTL